MYTIALLLTLSAAAQTPPPDLPKPLKPGEKTCAFKIEDQWVFGRFSEKEVDFHQGKGYFEIDDPLSDSPGKRNYTFEDFETESEYGNERKRNQRYQKRSAEWREENGYVQVEHPSGSKAWVTSDVVERSGRARTAALNVIKQREKGDYEIAIVPATANTVTETAEQPGMLQLWGPQAAVGFLGLVLMGIVARIFIFTGEGDWQKIE